jgi:hypothetical protein
VPLSAILSEVSDAVALEEAALAMQLEDVVVDTRSLQAPGAADAGEGRTGDVVASAA